MSRKVQNEIPMSRKSRSETEAGKLQNETEAGKPRNQLNQLNQIQRRKPFATLEQEVYLNLQRTADALAQGLEQTLRPEGLSATQYNVLRILRGAGEPGLSCTEIAARMLTHDPDVTRLLDRLQRRKLIRRRRQPRDRRVIRTRITPAGLQILSTLDQPIAALHERLLAHLGPERLQILNDLLAAARVP